MSKAADVAAKVAVATRKRKGSSTVAQGSSKRRAKSRQHLVPSEQNSGQSDSEFASPDTDKYDYEVCHLSLNRLGANRR